MRKKISIDRSIPRAPLPEELQPDWLSSAARPVPQEGVGAAAGRSLSIAS
jgi:hypothetical protein